MNKIEMICKECKRPFTIVWFDKIDIERVKNKRQLCLLCEEKHEKQLPSVELLINLAGCWR